MTKQLDYLAKMAERGDTIKPRVYGGGSGRRRDIQDILPKGASLSKQGYIYGANSLTQSGAQLHLQRPYDPEMESPDRWYYPTDRLVANKWWRLFYKYDPIFGTAIDMYSEMPVSNFDIVLEGGESSKEVVDLLYLMVEECQFLQRFKQMLAEFLVIGECIPHCFFDDDLGIWTYIGIHNPDLVEIKDAAVVNMEPIISFVPDESTRKLISDTSPEAREIRSRLPSEFVAKVLARQKIRLKNTNCSYVPRKLHSYDERGTSLASRMFRIWMVEDAVYNSTIATFRRAASPIKVAKFGHPNTGYIPTPDAQDEFMRQLTVAETDPQAWLAATYAVNFEAWGASDRAITISRENDVIERIKLYALGLSKGFMTGEVSFASVKGGLQVFLRRLLSLRQFWEAIWMKPKFFGPVMKMNGFVKSSPSELVHNYRMKRTGQQLAEENRYIGVNLEWKNSLDSRVNDELLRAYGQIKQQFDFTVSKETIGAAVDLDWRDEKEKAMRERLESKRLEETILGATEKAKLEEETKATKPPGGAGSGAKPPSATKPTTNKDTVSSPPGSSEGPGDKGPLDESVEPIGEENITTGV